ncbi:MAG: DUF2497 domain-containing protein [Rhizobiaceae bacterium]|nr:DUF2497 domain-containing protein [Rhizobiaceae bacterium]
MSNQDSNSARKIEQSEVPDIEEPSMDEILNSIKKIISDDDEAATSLEDREQYTHPTRSSNSNQLDEAFEADLEAGFEAAIEKELQDLTTDAPVEAPAEPSKITIKVNSQPNKTRPAIKMKSQIQDPVVDNGEAIPAEQAVESGDPVISDEDVASAETKKLEERVRQIRREVSEASAGLSTDARLDKYRVRGKLKMESLASETSAASAATAASSAAAASEVSAPPATPVASAAPAPQAAVSPAVAAGPVLPTSHAVAQEMANTMLAEKEDEIQKMLANMMRPTIRKWLSDNLPGMVEKLVREEIERVARGKQAS